MKNFKVALIIIIIIIFILASGLLFIKNRMLSSEILGLNQSMRELEAEVGRLVQENDTLQNDLEYARSAAAKEKLEKEELAKKLGQIKDTIEPGLIQAEQSKDTQLSDKTNLLETRLKDLSLEAGFLYKKTRDYGKAVVVFEKYLEFDPNNAQVHYELGLLYDKNKKDPERAILHYKKYLELSPQAPNIKEVENSIKRLER